MIWFYLEPMIVGPKLIIDKTEILVTGECQMVASSCDKKLQNQLKKIIKNLKVSFMITIVISMILCCIMVYSLFIVLC